MHTLGDVVTWALVVAAVIVVPYKLAKAWVWPLVRPFIMSRAPIVDRSYVPVSAPVDQPSTNTRQPIVMPDNAVNAELSGNAVAAPIPTEARDIIRMQAKAEAVAKLIRSAKMTNKAEAIELIFECSRSGREGSMYKRAQALVDAILAEYKYPDLDDQHRRVAEQQAA